jgi:serine phosphatase RsbU (regulator of sigma subunit)
MNVEEVGREISQGADALIISEEVLEEDSASYLQRALAGQPEWSSLPVLLMVADGYSSPLATAIQEWPASVQVLTYPVALATFASAIRSALAGRRRQYQVRDLMVDLAERGEALRGSEKRYRTLFDSIDEGFCVIEVLFDEADQPIDYRLLEVNAAYERQTGIKNAAGRRVREIVPELEKHWFEIYGGIAKSGQAMRFENSALALGRYYDVYAFRVGDPAQRRVAVLFNDISARKKAEAALRESQEKYRILAAENDRLYRQQLDIAETLQLALLNIPSEIGPLRIGHLYRSATEAARVGGDFYDVFPVKDGATALLIGDVSGHGIQAARTATLVRDVVHAFTHQSVRADEVLERTNLLLTEKKLPGFVTVFLGILDTETGELRYCSAGHPETMLRRASGETLMLGSGGPPLGIFPEASWKPHRMELEVNDLLLLYTDGVLEARRDGEMFGEKRLMSLLESARVSPDRLPGLILETVLAHSGGTLTDDVAVLAVLFADKAGGIASKKKPFVQERLIG